MNLVDLRKGYGLSQKDASAILNVPERTYRRYEQDENYGSIFKRQMFINILNEHCAVTETKGVLTVNNIITAIKNLFDIEYKGQIEFCYLFGSYAKGYAKESSDVDLCVATNLSGLKFAGLSESIRQVIHKKIDLIRFSNLNGNIELINEIMKDGIKIYG